MKVCVVCKEQCPPSRYSMMQWFQEDSRCDRCVKEEDEQGAEEGQEDDTSANSCIPGPDKKKISQVDTLTTGLSYMEMSNIKPPRTVDQILGELSEPTESVIYELLLALEYERTTSTTYLKAVKQLSNEYSTDVPRTFETKSMISTNNFFLMGHLPFSLRKHSFSNSDIGAGLLLDFKDRDDNDLHPIVYLGECHFSPLDLWHFAMITKKNANNEKKVGLPERLQNFDSLQPEKANHHSVLLCPFCATLLDPLNADQTYIMLARMLYEFVGDMNLGFDVAYQLCCKSCFVKNLLVKNDKDWSEFPGCERYGLLQNMLNSKSLVATTDMPKCPYAEDLCSWTMKSGLAKSGCMYLMENISANYSDESAKHKIKLSKSLTKASGREVMKISMTHFGKRRCFACGLHIVKTSACSKCKNAHYCSKPCQRLHWRVHKKICSPETKVEPLPGNIILLNTKDRYSTEERQNPENFCKSCKKFTGDSHGKETYCFGCAKFLYCGPCNGMPKNNDGKINCGNPAKAYKGCCPDCIKHLDTKANVLVTALENLIEKNPTGIHVKHMRLCIAQFLLDGDDLNESVVYAMKEIKWLANNLDYAPAQLLLASLHDPVCQNQDLGVYNGPMHMAKFSKRNFYEANIAIAKKYYERACEQKLSSALVVVGTYYKTGSNPYMFKKDEAKGMEMLEEAAAMGHTQAMYDVGSIYLFEKRDKKKGIEFLRGSASNGHYDAMFCIGMEGRMDKNLRSLGKWCVLKLLQEKITFGEKQHLLKDAAFVYGIL
ncbi:hypothetical protein CTEN210_04200 [Chaetoceros tenuissimus]|uniref:MYND-type domain-containing protein n=1 Tax=Chaetoceros tenuissimus TaxID=426638 RepID=A0AAD3CMF7_9STRA|nr:hypothetical protein CTEN210_04200 [Chaetoceros tenuissimus]